MLNSSVQQRLPAFGALPGVAVHCSEVLTTSLFFACTWWVWWMVSGSRGGAGDERASPCLAFSQPLGLSTLCVCVSRVV